MKAKILAAVAVATAATALGAAKYEATWESLDSRPTPEWWKDAKLGIFIHWGCYAVPAYAPTGEEGFGDGYSEWYDGRLQMAKKTFIDHHAKHYGNAPYGNFAAQFFARFFDAAKWADVFRRAGAKYAVLTSKHHDGYALWPSPESPHFNSVSLGPGRDIAREFCDALAAAGLKRGFYYSLLEYTNPMYPMASNYGCKAKCPIDIATWVRIMNIPQMKELVEDYGADIIWTDGEWDYSADDLQSKEFLAWLYNESRMKDSVAVNDRWGIGCRARHGGYWCTEYGHIPDVEADAGFDHPWEENRGIGRSFGYNRFETVSDYLSREELIRLFARIVGSGGNLLLDVGPDPDGLIPPIMEERLLQLGAWIDAHKEAIYGTRRGPVQEKDRLTSTKKGGDVWVFALDPELKTAEFTLDGKSFSFPLPPPSEDPVRVVRVKTAGVVVDAATSR